MQMLFLLARHFVIVGVYEMPIDCQTYVVVVL